MALAHINLSAKQYFNFMCRNEFERRVFHDSYKEFQKKSKPYSLNNALHTFSTMCDANGKANSLHQKLHYSVMNSIISLENKIPVLTDMDNQQVLFDVAELKIINSDLLNKAAHIVSITYTTPKLVLHEIVGDMLILSYDEKGKFNKTFMVKMTDDLVLSYEKSKELVYS